jgi:hypothetical protein
MHDQMDFTLYKEIHQYKLFLGNLFNLFREKAFFVLNCEETIHFLGSGGEWGKRN